MNCAEDTTLCPSERTEISTSTTPELSHGGSPVSIGVLSEIEDPQDVSPLVLERIGQEVEHTEARKAILLRDTEIISMKVL
jgi:hypothetical protein